MLSKTLGGETNCSFNVVAKPSEKSYHSAFEQGKRGG